MPVLLWKGRKTTLPRRDGRHCNKTYIAKVKTNISRWNFEYDHFPLIKYRVGIVFRSISAVRADFPLDIYLISMLNYLVTSDWFHLINTIIILSLFFCIWWLNRWRYLACTSGPYQGASCRSYFILSCVNTSVAIVLELIQLFISKSWVNSRVNPSCSQTSVGLFPLICNIQRCVSMGTSGSFVLENALSCDSHKVT